MLSLQLLTATRRHKTAPRAVTLTATCTDSLVSMLIPTRLRGLQPYRPKCASSLDPFISQLVHSRLRRRGFLWWPLAPNWPPQEGGCPTHGEYIMPSLERVYLCGEGRRLKAAT